MAEDHIQLGKLLIKNFMIYYLIPIDQFHGLNGHHDHSFTALTLFIVTRKGLYSIDCFLKSFILIFNFWGEIERTL